MKNTLKRTFAVLGATALTASMASMTAFAASTPMANYCDKQDNAEVKYDGSYWKQPTAWNVAAIDPSSYNGSGAEVVIDKVEVDEKDAPNSIQTVNIVYNGPEEKVSSIAFHILWDTRMEIQKQKGGRTVISNADSLFDFASVETPIEAGLVSIASSAGGNNLYKGTMYTMQFKLPADAKAGDVYPVGIRYQYDGKTGDLFYDADQTQAGKLHMAYVFSQGIENGYVKVKGVPTTTTTTTTTSTTTTTTTSSTTTTTSTSPVTTTTTSNVGGSDTTTTTSTTGKAGSATTTKSGSATTTKKPATTTKKAATTTKKADAPKTGVAGVGVAAAGLAIAVGTAFVLRKKED